MNFTCMYQVLLIWQGIHYSWLYEAPYRQGTKYFARLASLKNLRKNFGNGLLALRPIEEIYFCS